MEAPSNEIEEEDTPEIISFDQGNDKFTVNHIALGKVISDIQKDEKVIIISVLGQPKSGKSFLANWIAKYLKYNNGANGDQSWVGNDDDKLKGFKWNSNLSEEMDHEGNGIRTFKHSNKLHGVSILVLDIDLKAQPGEMTGEKDQEQHQRNYHALVSICTMISSLIIWVENGQQVSDEKDGLKFRSILEIIAGGIPERTRFDIQRDIVFVLNKYFPHQNSDNFKDLPITNSELFRTREVTMPNLLNNKNLGYFLGEPKYMNKHELDMFIRNIAPINEFLAVRNEAFNNLKYVIDIIEKAVNKMNQDLGNTQLDMEQATNVPAAEMEKPNIDHTESVMDLGVVNRIEECMYGDKKCTAQQQLQSFQSTVDTEPDANLPTECPKPQPTQNSVATHENRDQLKSSTASSNPKFSTEQIITFITDKINQILLTNLKVFMLSAHSRSCFLEHVNELILTKYSAALQTDGYDMDTITTVQAVAKNCVAHMVEYFKPITTSLSISLLTIESEFDSRIYFEDENELLQLINLAQQSSARKFKSGGAPSEQLQKSFDKCWTVISDNFKCRNRKVGEYKNKIELKLVENVLGFYKNELNTTLSTCSGNNRLLRIRIPEIKAEAIKIMCEVSEFSRNKPKLMKLLDEGIAGILDQTTGTVKDAGHESSTHCGTEGAHEEPTGSQAGHVANEIPESRRPPPSSSNTKASRKQGALIIHFSRTDYFKCAFIQQDTSSKFVLTRGASPAKAIGYLEGEFVLYKNHLPNSLDLRKFNPGNLKPFLLDGDGREETFCYEEAVGLSMAKIRTYFEATVGNGEQITARKCILIIPVVTPIIERQAIYDSAKCAGFQTVHLISETTSVAAAFLTSNSIRKQDKNLMVTFLSHEKLEIAVQTISMNTYPCIRTESISGSLFKQYLSSYFDKFPGYRKTDDQKYFRDAMHLAKLKDSDLSRIILAGDCQSANRSLKGYEFSRLDRTMDFCGSALNGAVQLALLSLNEGIAWNSLFVECLPFEVVLKTVARELTLLDRCAEMPAKATGKINICKEQKISFDIIQKIGTEEIILGNYFVCIDGDAKWNTLEINVEIDYCGLMKVSGNLTNTKSKENKSREVIMQRNYTLNKAQDKLPAIQQKINGWLKLSEEKQVRLKLLKLSHSYVEIVKYQVQNLDSSMQKIFWQSANGLIDLLSQISSFNRQLVKAQLSILLQIHSKQGIEVGIEELSKINKLIE